MIRKGLVLTGILLLGLSLPAFGQTYDFDDGSMQGWYSSGPYDENGFSDFTSNFSQMYWDDQTNYPNGLGQDPIRDGNGSITITADNGHGIYLPNSSWWILRFHSENLAELGEWQNADGYTVQINENMGDQIYANLYVRVYDFDLNQDRYFYSGNAQPLTSNSWNSLTFDNWSSLSGFPTNYQVEEIFINIWGELADNFFGPVNIDQVVPIPRNSDITIATVPAGLDIVVDGQTYTSPRTFSWEIGSQHNISTNSPQNGGTGTRYIFDRWSNQLPQSHTITVPSSNATLTAYFDSQYYLTMNASTGGTVSPTSGWRDAGSGVQIQATAGNDYGFTQWTGSGSGSYTGSNNPANITMNGPITETASFGQITVLQPNGGEVLYVGDTYQITWTKTNISYVYIEYSTNGGENWSPVASEIVPDFYNWTIPNTPSNDCIIRVIDNLGGIIHDDSDAPFTISSGEQITVTTSPSGRSFQVDGTTYSSAQTFTWIPGSQHTIATTSPQSGATGVQYIYNNWSDGGAISHTITTPGTATTYTAHFATQYYLTMNTGTGGTVSPASGWHNAGEGVQITATPSGAYSFGSWTGSGSGSYTGSNNPANVTMNGPVTETATFSLNPVAITVNTNVAGRSFTVDGTTYTSRAGI